MPVITISRELGSEGTNIAQMVAAQIGAPCIDKEVLAEMAQQAGISVQVMAAAEEQLLARPIGVSDEMRAFWSARRGKGVLSEAQFVQHLTAALRLLAAQENVVFVGRGAQVVLRDHPGALHVHLYAPLDARAARIQQQRNLPALETAQQIIRKADEQRRDWFRHFFRGVDWKSPKHYHLLIDTARIPPKPATALIVQAAQATPQPATA
ncbi:MAG: cytidylate kinase family protein [Caldilineaceae bacterium]|nr:cytidylate kinase family protein [Caldilineaceae bacterium]